MDTTILLIAALIASVTANIGLIVVLTKMHEDTKEERRELYNRIQAGTLSDYAQYRPIVDREDEQLRGRTETVTIYPNPMDGVDMTYDDIAEIQAATHDLMEH